MRLILASRSPRRAELLTAAGYEFEVRAADVDEEVRRGESPESYVERLAREKATAVFGACSSNEARAGLSDLVVLGADTAVVVGEGILGKPEDPADGARMLRTLSGRAHRVLTGLAVKSERALVSRVETTTVWFDELTEAQVTWYVASGEGEDKAGGYAIQGLAGRFIPRIDGSYANVVGLPIGGLDGLIARVRTAPSLLASEE